VSGVIGNVQARRSTLTIVAALALSAAPLLVLVVPAILRLPAVAPLLHESEIFPGFSRVSLVAAPVAGLVVVNLVVFAGSRSLRSLLVASLITSALAWLLVVGAVGLVNDLNEMSTGPD
jgi:hypothetical protein